LAEVPIPGHSRSPDVAGATTLSTKDNSKDRSHSSGSNGFSSLGPVAADSSDVFSIGSASDTDREEPFDPLRSKGDSYRMSNLGSQTGNGEGPSAQGQNSIVVNGEADGLDIISPRAQAHKKTRFPSVAGGSFGEGRRM
jgi:hypothetical protein